MREGVAAEAGTEVCASGMRGAATKVAAQSYAGGPAAKTAATGVDYRRRQRSWDSAALAAFDTLVNGSSAGQPQDVLPAPSRRQIDPDAFALEFARYDHSRREQPGGFVLEPGRTSRELAVMAETGELYDSQLLGCLLRARLACMLSAMEGVQDFYYVARALRHIPQWALESPEERDERLNASAGISVQETRRMRREEAESSKAQVPRSQEEAKAGADGPGRVDTSEGIVRDWSDYRAGEAQPAESESGLKSAGQTDSRPLNRAQRRRLAKLQEEQAKQRKQQ